MRWLVAIVLVLSSTAATARPTRDPVAVVIAVDRSARMGKTAVEAAREAVRASAFTLTAGDDLAVIGFDAYSEVLVPLAPVDAKAASKAVNNLVLSTRAAGDMLAALTAARDQLRGVTARAKHVIVVTASDTPDLAEVDKLARTLADEGVTITVIGWIGIDRAMAALVVDPGEGRLYMVEDLGALPKICMKEIRQLLVSKRAPRSSRRPRRNYRRRRSQEARAWSARAGHRSVGIDAGAEARGREEGDARRGRDAVSR